MESNTKIEYFYDWQKNSIDDWFNFLQTRCFQNNFYQTYQLLDKINEGKYSDSYRIKDKSDNLDFLAKMYRIDEEDKIRKLVNLLFSP